MKLQEGQRLHRGKGRLHGPTPTPVPDRACSCRKDRGCTEVRAISTVPPRPQSLTGLALRRVSVEGIAVESGTCSQITRVPGEPCCPLTSLARHSGARASLQMSAATFLPELLARRSRRYRVSTTSSSAGLCASDAALQALLTLQKCSSCSGSGEASSVLVGARDTLAAFLGE